MTVTLRLPPELESRLRDRAAIQGLKPADLATQLLSETLQEASDREKELLNRTKSIFDAAFWKRYRKLIARRQDETLTSAEQSELIACSNRLEEWNARRMAAVAELASLRGKPFIELLMELKIGPLQGVEGE